jgi:DNA-binding NarL/FixJ family response regulator
MEIKILLCDDHKIFREGLKTLLAAERGMRVVGEAADGAKAVSLAASLRPDIIVMDISMPVLNGIEATRKIIAAGKGGRVIALSMHSDRRFVAEALKAGARGYLLKDSAFEELSAAIRSVHAGKTYLDPAVASAVVDDYVGRIAASERSAFTLLSGREREVLQLVAEGKSTKAIASALKLSVKTVETHRNRVMGKLRVDSVAALTKYAVREGLTSL